MKKIISISLLALISFYCKAQKRDLLPNFYKDYYGAYLHLKTHQDSMAVVNFYKKALVDYRDFMIPVDNQFDKGIVICYRLGFTKLATDILLFKIEKGLNFEQLNYMARSSQYLSEFLKLEQNQKILSKYDSLQGAYKSSVDWNKSFELTELYAIDQYCRDLGYESFVDYKAFVNSWKNIHDEDASLESELMKYTDSINIIQFCDFISKNGFPNYEMVGMNSSYFMLLLHTFSVCSDLVYTDGTKVFDFLDSALKAEVIAGQFSNAAYASLVDRAYGKFCGLPQIYGTKFWSFNGKYELEYPIDDIANVDKRRAEIFLPPLYESALLYGFDLPEGYIVPKE